MTQDETKQAIAEYVKVAEAALKENYGSDFTQDTVMKLASAMIEHDVEVEAAAELEKEAEIVLEAAFVDEFNKLAGTNEKSAAAIFDTVKSFAKNYVGDVTGRNLQAAEKAQAFVGEAKKARNIARGVTAGAGALAVGGTALALKPKKD